MPSLQAAKASNTLLNLGYTPVALFVGGTSGIGQASAEAFARYTKGNAHVIISGRNEAAALAILAKLPRTPTSTYEFLSCDATLMSNISTACASLTSPSRSPGKPLTKLNYLFLTPGFLSFRNSRDETVEGLDKKFALNFYSRWKFVMELMPLLKAAKDAGEEARVVTVLGAGYGGKADLDDLGLKKTYSLIKSGLQSPTYNSLVVEEFSRRHPDLGFTHISPGGVNTGAIGSGWHKYLLRPLSYLFLTSPDDCAEWMVHCLFDPKFAKGAFHLNNHAEPIPESNLYLTDESRTKVYEHLVETVNRK